MSNCGKLGIPEHLHTRGRIADDEFEPGERYFRRFEKVSELSEENKISMGAITTRHMSGNREKYSSQPSDVLYNIHGGDHFFSWGIWGIDIEKVNQLSFQHPEEAKHYTLKVLHVPEECMYPHAEIVVFKDGQPVQKIANSVKTKIREAISNLSNVLQLPEQPF